MVCPHSHPRESPIQADFFRAAMCCAFQYASPWHTGSAGQPVQPGGRTAPLSRCQENVEHLSNAPPALPAWAASMKPVSNALFPSTYSRPGQACTCRTGRIRPWRMPRQPWRCTAPCSVSGRPHSGCASSRPRARPQVQMSKYHAVRDRKNPWQERQPRPATHPHSARMMCR